MGWTIDRLLSLAAVEKERLGAVYTPGEIMQQPDTWEKTAAMVAAALDDWATLLAGVDHVVVTGAGTSAYVGISVESLLRRALTLPVQAIPTTDIAVDPQGALPKGRLLLVSVARSGNSPESVAALRLVDQVRPGSRHLVVTCNAAGQLAKAASEMGDRGRVLVLPPETNDQGLAMTSSYSNLVVACQGLAFLDQADQYVGMVRQAAAAAREFLAGSTGAVGELAALPFQRAVFLGNGGLKGAAVESHLKLQEMTAGQVVCQAETSLGLRHGPMAVIDRQTLVVHYLSSDSYMAKYEVDILSEIGAKGLGLAVVAVGHAAELDRVVAGVKLAIPGPALPDECRPLVHVLVGQLLGLFRSLELGYKPDTPSAGGVINRVVQGVVIHPFGATD